MTRISLMEIFALHAAAKASLETGLLAHLAQTPASATQAAEALELSDTGVALILEVLASAGLVDADAHGYKVPHSLARELAGPDSANQVWSGTRDLVAHGHARSDGSLAQRGPAYAGVVTKLAEMFFESANALAARLAPALPRGAQILDVGAGAGAWSLGLLERRTDLRVTAIDLPDVVPHFEEAARARGVIDQIDVLPGDYHVAALPRGRFHLAMFANVLHLEPPERARSLLTRLAPSITGDGRLVVVDAYPGPGREPARLRAAYALHLGLRLPGARPHHEDEVRAWMAQAGFSDAVRVPLDPEADLLAALVAAR